LALAGLRVGYMIADPEIIDYIYRVKMPFSLNLFSEIAAVTVLNNPDLIENNVLRILSSKEQVIKELNKLDCINVYPSFANFFAIDVGQPGSEIARELAIAGIAVRDISSYPLMQNYIRICVGTEEENNKLIEGLKRMFMGDVNE
jgi:histidinol-phosphate aminotransferase